MQITEYWIIITALFAGGLIGFLIRHRIAGSHSMKLDTERVRLAQQMDAKTKELEITAANELNRQKDALETELSRRRKDLRIDLERVTKREDQLEQRDDKLQNRELELGKRQSKLDRKGNDLDKQQKEQEEELQRISGLTRDQAREQLLSSVEEDARGDMARVIREIEAQAKEQGEERARKIVVTAMQRIGTDEFSENTITAVPIPSDDMKGRIIGRNGRNIRAFENAAHVDVIVDDTPEAVTVSSFDPVRREVARRALAKLVQDGRIHPSHIEKVVSKANKEVELVMKEEGEKAAYATSVIGLGPEILRLLGRLKFRTSYGQEQCAHAVETALLSGAIAAEVGADTDIAKAGGLLHDIGKAIDHEVEGTHAAIGAEICRRYGVGEVICNAIAAHHHEVDQESLEAVIVEVSDAISGARPGARREGLEQYIKRVRTLEDIANSFQGVDQAYALQAGREVRVIVTPSDVDDFTAMKISRDVARKIEESMQYPGQIQVTVIRETRAIEYAK